MEGSNVGRQDESCVVAVGHDRGADHARAEAPRRPVGMLALVVAVEEFDAGGACEVLAEHVAGPRLERLGVAHHRLDGGGVDGPWELLALALAPADDRDGQPILGNLPVALEAGLYLGGRLFLSRMERVGLLP